MGWSVEIMEESRSEQDSGIGAFYMKHKLGTFQEQCAI